MVKYFMTEKNSYGGFDDRSTAKRRIKDFGFLGDSVISIECLNGDIIYTHISNVRITKTGKPEENKNEF